jgi:hypothetical protein
MNKMTIGFAAAALGAATMYLLDPDRGRRRRARLREMGSHASHRAQAIAGVTGRDVRHRLSGAAARTLDRLVEEAAPADEVLVERVRARLGRLVAHPGAIDVVASGGTVTVSGPVFAAEVDQLIDGVADVAGVTAVENKLEAHADAEHVPALQGPGPKTLPSASARWRRWTPTTRLAAGLAGVALLAASSTRQSARATATRIAGAELLARAVL